jgi:hypothetical protein
MGQVTGLRSTTARRLVRPYYNGGSALSLADALAIEAEAREGYVPASLSPEWNAELNMTRAEACAEERARITKAVESMRWESLGHGRYVWLRGVLAIVNDWGNLEGRDK